MRRSALAAWGLALVLAVAGTTARGGEEAPPSARQAFMEKLLQNAIDRFEMGEYLAAKAKLDRLLAEAPTDKECLALRDAVGSRILARMALFEVKGRNAIEAALEILNRAQSFEQEQLLDPDNIHNTVAAAVRDFSNEPAQLVRISQLGQYAVPELIQYLREGNSEEFRTNASYLLIHIGPAAVPPLTEALKSTDPLMLQHLCQILREIRPADPRAVPALKRVSENEAALPAVREKADKALARITGEPAGALLPAAAYYYMEANRFYLGGPEVEDELDTLTGTLWAWNPAGGKDGKGALEAVPVPRYLLDDILVEKLAYEGMALTREKSPFLVLLASVLIQEALETDTLEEVLDVRGVVHPESLRLQGLVGAWRERFHRNKRLAWTIGPVLLVDVLDKALLDGKTEVALGAIDGIERVGGRESWSMIRDWLPAEGRREREEALERDQPGDAGVTGPGAAVFSGTADETAHPLMLALRHPDRRIRFAAANCLPRIGLSETDPRFRAIVPVLVNGAQEKVARIALIISNDAARREKYSTLLAEKGFATLTSPSGRQGVRLARQDPPKDAVVLDAAVEEFERMDLILSAAESENSSSLLPLVVVSNRGRASEIMERLDELGYTTRLHTDIEPTDSRIFEELLSMRRVAPEEQLAAVLTNEERERRLRLKEAILMNADRHMRPQAQSELLRLLNEKRLLTDSVGLRSAFAQVYLDEELAGYDAIRTVQALRGDPRSRYLPVALLCSARDRNAVEAAFAAFQSDKGGVAILGYDAGARDLAETLENLIAEAPRNQKEPALQWADAIAKLSAEALLTLDPASNNVDLTPEEVLRLMDVLGDNSREEALRVAVARVLGHFRTRRAADRLAKVFRESNEKMVDLRVACMDALGLIDRANDFKDLKLLALDDPEARIQDSAARALSISASDQALRTRILREERVNDLLALKEAGKGMGQKAEGGGEAPGEASPEGAAPAEAPKENPLETKDDFGFFDTGTSDKPAEAETPAAETETKDGGDSGGGFEDLW